MHTIILIAHIITMVTSVAFMSSAVAMGLLGNRSAITVANLGMAITVVGGLSGVLLMLDSPLSIQCALLAAYLAAVTTLHIFGFAMGDPNGARLIRSSVKND